MGRKPPSHLPFVHPPLTDKGLQRLTRKRPCLANVLKGPVCEIQTIFQFEMLKWTNVIEKLNKCADTLKISVHWIVDMTMINTFTNSFRWFHTTCLYRVFVFCFYLIFHCSFLDIFKTLHAIKAKKEFYCTGKLVSSHNGAPQCDFSWQEGVTRQNFAASRRLTRLASFIQAGDSGQLLVPMCQNFTSHYTPGAPCSHGVYKRHNRPHNKQAV